MKLKYPKGYSIRQKEKAERIRKTSKQKKPGERRNQRKWISIPNFKNAETISKSLEETGQKV